MTIINLETRAHLITLYSENHRHYHTLEHIYDCLTKLEEYPEMLSSREYSILEAAIWFHDAIYNPKSRKNEENSADLLGNAPLGLVNSMTVGDIKRLILVTKSHTPQNGLENIMCDIDLSILGCLNRKDYEKYQYQVYKEYDFVPFPRFCEARKQFLNKMLGLDRIFKTEYYFNKHEETARKNMAWELSILK